MATKENVLIQDRRLHHMVPAEDREILAKLQIPVRKHVLALSEKQLVELLKRGDFVEVKAK